MNAMKPTGRLLKAVASAVVSLVALVAIIAWFAGAFTPKIAPDRKEVGKRPLDPKPTVVEIHEVIQDFPEVAVGTLKAASRTVVSAKVLATIDEVLVAAGDEVEKGQVLVRLSSSDLEARLKQAQEASAAVKAKADVAESEFRRDERLRKSNAISRTEFDASRAAMLVARAEVGRAEQAMKEATVLLSFATIKAVKIGRVVDRLAEPGDTAVPGQPLLTLYDATSLRLEAPVSESLAITLKVGRKLKARIDALDKVVDATVDQIVPQAEAASRSFLVKARLKDADGLFEGMFGRLIIPAGKRSFLCLPTAAIRRVGQLEFVDVVGSDDVVERRFVKVGRSGIPGMTLSDSDKPARVEVLSGLRPGDRVVLRDDPSKTVEKASGEKP